MPQNSVKPAPPGTGVIAGGAVRAVVEAAGIKDVVSKILGTKNQASNVYATIEALKQLGEKGKQRLSHRETKKHKETDMNRTLLKNLCRNQTNASDGVMDQGE